MRALVTALFLATSPAAVAGEICWSVEGTPGLSVVTDETGNPLYTTSDLYDCATVTEGLAICTDEAGDESPIVYKIAGDAAVFDYHRNGPRNYRRIACD